MSLCPQKKEGYMCIVYSRGGLGGENNMLILCDSWTLYSYEIWYGMREHHIPRM